MYAYLYSIAAFPECEHGMMVVVGRVKRLLLLLLLLLLLIMFI